MYLKRNSETTLKGLLKRYPVTAIIGPRQCGKSTLAKHLLQSISRSIYLDLERPSDFTRLTDPELFFNSQNKKLICIDEVQRKPDLFQVIRSMVDEWGENSKFLLLGSASRDLLNQSSETLAGRIAYLTLTPFQWSELPDNKSMHFYFSAGGFPKSILAGNERESFEWRENFITTFLERDLKQWAGFSAMSMRRLWQMLAHYNGQTVNYSAIGNSLGLSHVTIKHYIDLLQDTFMIYTLPPYVSNTGKRMVKAPKVYIADSGITAALLGLLNFEQMTGHPNFGSFWEQITISQLKAIYPDASFFHYRTSNGAEIDVVMKLRNKIIAIECKATMAPVLSKGNYLALEDIQPDFAFISAMVKESWDLKDKMKVVPLDDLIQCISKFIKH
jgi:uncharacterized protein